MRVLDFDNTVYDGESIVDFYLFSLKYNFKVIKFMPIVIISLVKYKLNRITYDKLMEIAEKYATSYVNSFEDIPKMVSIFWDKNIKKIKKWYKVREDDVLLTASFDIIMDELCRRLKIKRCICSEFDLATKETKYLNFGKNKKEIFLKQFGENTVIDEFYADHKADKPMFELSKKAFLVKGNKIKQVKP